MPRDRISSPLTFAIGFIVAGNCAALAAEPATRTSVITNGPLSFEPLLNAEVAQDDNIFESADNEVDSWVTRIAPSIVTSIDTGGQHYKLSYQGEFGRYADSHDDDYDDHNFSAEAEWNPGLRSRVNLSANYDMVHEDRGTGLTEGFDSTNAPIAEPDELDTTQFSGSYAYGSNGSIGRIVLAAGYRDTEYQNHRARTQYRDREDTQVGATFYYNVLPATSLLFEVRGNDISYAIDQPGIAPLDNSEIRYLLGATWDITGLTSGTIKLGQVEKKFDDAAREDFSGFDWEIDLRWSPRSYSHIDLVAAREEEETYGNGDFIDVKRYAISWSHGWTDNFETRLEGAYLDEVFQGEDRAGESYDYSIVLGYQWRRWLALELGADFSDRDSNIDRLEFNRTVYSLSANLSL